jgi:hypothetical protein
MKNIKEYLKIENKEITLYHKNGGIAFFYWEGENEEWNERAYHTSGRLLTYKDSSGYWARYTCDEDGDELTFENSKGNKRGFDVEEMTMEQICKALGKTIKITK